MLKKLLAALLLLTTVFSAQSQIYRNEWIDYSKTYYKVKIAQTGLFRITGATLSSMGLTGVNSNNFRLIRNGQQVPMFTNVSNAVLGATDYIEFWGMKNDGKPDTDLYYDVNYQIADGVSMETDTAAFFLTNMGAATGNLRINNQAFTLTGAEVAPAYFMHTSKRVFKDRIHKGDPYDISGTRVYTSTYDKGEGWVSKIIYPGTAANTQLVETNVLPFAYPTGPASSLYVTAVGDNTYNYRSMTIRLNGTIINGSTPINFNTYDYVKATVPSIPSTLLTATNTLGFATSTADPNDVSYLGTYEFTYPRQFNFGGASSFEFTMPTAATDTYIEIQNFNHNLTAPILWDLTNNRRYTCTLAGASTATNGIIKVKLAPSTVPMKLILLNASATGFSSLASTQFQAKTFRNFGSAANQGDFLIISNSALMTGVNPVEQYRAYRATANGGSFNSKVYDIDELYDQFAYGINRHPISIKNFLKYARNNFASAPKFTFLIGKGVGYGNLIKYEGSNPDAQNFVPTWGEPASDNLMASNNQYGIPSTPIGRLSAINNVEVLDYLQKVQEMEASQASPFTLANKKWQKSVVHIEGSTDATIGFYLLQSLNDYKKVANDSLWGSNVITYSKSANPAGVALASNYLAQDFQDGVSLLTYYGHSSPNSLDFNLSDPAQYNNQGKYPMYLVLGCEAGDFFTYDPCRPQAYTTISEKFILAKQRGASAFIASTHFGVVNYLNFFTTNFYEQTNSGKYNQTIGQALIASYQQTLNFTGTVDPLGRGTIEQSTLHGDPALKLNQYPNPDYIIEPSEISISPANPSVGDSVVNVKVRIYNVGKYLRDSVTVKIDRQLPIGSTVTLFNKKIKAIAFVDSVSVRIPMIAARDFGTSTITATVDGVSAIAEMSEANNSSSLTYSVTNNECLPVVPYNYAIVTTTGAVVVKASTVDPFAPLTSYRMECDTTELFNSALKNTQTISQIGGLMQFTLPSAMLTNNKVYYWRVSPLAGSTPVKWNVASFLYNPGGNAGAAQAHFYQYFKSNYDAIRLDSTTRNLDFGRRINNLFITQSIYGQTYSLDGDFSVSVNGNSIIRSACLGLSVCFNVFDPITFKPWVNTTGKLYNSGNLDLTDPYFLPCVNGAGYNIRQYNFEYRWYGPSYDSAAKFRKRAMDFMDAIPNGYYVAVRVFDPVLPECVPSTWIADQALYGAGNTLYHKLKNAGFADIDGATINKVWAFVYRKGDPTGTVFDPISAISTDCKEQVKLNANCITKDTIGYIKSPLFGPSTAWNQVVWNGFSTDPTANRDLIRVDVIGVNNAGVETVLYTLDSTQKVFNITGVNATTYPYMRLRMLNADSTFSTPYQLRDWKITYTPVAEGALTPNETNDFTATTIGHLDSLRGKISFRNISNLNFDSLRVVLKVLDSTGTEVRVINLSKTKPVIVGDSVQINYVVNNLVPWANQRMILYFEVNPIGNQLEQFHFNNVFSRPFSPVTTLPVTLINFNARPYADKVLVDWQVTEERAFSHYEVEHSADGIHFTKVGVVNKQQLGANVNNYSFYHNNPVQGKNYYRLRSVNLDGTAQYSPIKIVLFGKASTITVYPNPTTDVLYVNSTTAQQLNVKLMNTLGQVLAVKVGNGNVRIDLSGFANGTYLLQIEDGAETKTVKVQKQ
jgi:hypothetical protein